METYVIVRRNGWRTPFLRLERLAMALMASLAGRLVARS